jgi:hypothetical protein
MRAARPGAGHELDLKKVAAVVQEAGEEKDRVAGRGQALAIGVRKSRAKDYP